MTGALLTLGRQKEQVVLLFGLGVSLVGLRADFPRDLLFMFELNSILLTISTKGQFLTLTPPAVSLVLNQNKSWASARRYPKDQLLVFLFFPIDLEFEFVNDRQEVEFNHIELKIVVLVLEVFL
jgi:hypothetical protein